jgi:hypothetical protein
MRREQKRRRVLPGYWELSTRPPTRSRPDSLWISGAANESSPPAGLASALEVLRGGVLAPG